MHRSKARRLMVATAIGSTLTLTGMAFADDTAKPDKPEAVHPQKSSSAAQRRAEPTEVAIQASADQVKELQRELASRGFYQGPIDGVAGFKTRAALRNFQVQQGISIQGGLNEQTRDSLGLDWERQPVKGTAEPERTPARGNADDEAAVQTRTRSGTDGSHVELAALNAEQTKEVQERLRDLGFYRGPVDGVFGAGTRTAMTRYFQRQAELASQGRVDDSTMELFGLEASDVKAKPKP